MSQATDPASSADAPPVKSTNVRSPFGPPSAVVATACHAASWLAPRLTQRALALRFFTPPAPRPVSRAAEELLARADQRLTVRIEKPDGFAFAWPGARTLLHESPAVHVTAWGRGPAVYLLHGWGGRGAQWSSFIDPLVRAGHTAVVLDAPAHGESPGTWTTIPQFAAALAAVADALGPAHAAIGHSLGGAAVAFALRRGFLTPRVALLAAPANPEAFFDEFANHAPLRASLRRSLRPDAGRALGFDFDELAVRAPPEPTAALLVHANDDRQVPHGDSLRIAGAWPSAVLAPCDRVGHFGVLRNERVVARVVAFVSGDRDADVSAPHVGSAPGSC